jgi:hypothetical protein
LKDLEELESEWEKMKKVRADSCASAADKKKAVSVKVKKGK